uniref:hypothetical protein n=1 Tax=Escherichia coli TaxID=562 RepID=UPI001F1D9516|nr:hypothetical protein [Escherichia coli]UGK56378.1 hypothetical protein [Escherichia coli]
MNQSTQTMAENLSTSLSTNASANTGMTLDSRQAINPDRFSDSIRNKKTLAMKMCVIFARKKMVLMRMPLWRSSIPIMTHLRPALSWVHNSNVQMRWWQRHVTLVSKKIAIDTARGETAESNKQDLRETSSLLKGLVADFGGNAQQMLPITNQLDRITGDASGINTIAQAQDRTPEHVNTSSVMSADRVADVGQSMDAQAKSRAGTKPTKMLTSMLVDKLSLV